MIHAPSAAAFLRTVCQAAGCLVTVAAFADYMAENACLKIAVADLEQQITELSAENAAYEVIVGEAFRQSEAATTVIRRIEAEERDR